MTYMTVDGIKLLFEQPDTTTKNGRRDLPLLSLMYDSGARVQEIIDLTLSCKSPQKSYSFKVDRSREQVE
jgi:integrase/recombinase XerD